MALANGWRWRRAAKRLMPSPSGRCTSATIRSMPCVARILRACAMLAAERMRQPIPRGPTTSPIASTRFGSSSTISTRGAGTVGLFDLSDFATAAILHLPPT